jgi:hypothetical protein
MTYQTQIKSSGFRLLNEAELKAVSGGLDPQGDEGPEIVVTGLNNSVLPGWLALTNSSIDDYFTQLQEMPEDPYGYGGGIVPKEYYSEEYWEKRENVFKSVVKALIKGDPATKEAAATAITEIRNQLLNLVSLESKKAASDFLELNARQLGEALFGGLFDGAPTPENGKDFFDNFLSLFGQNNNDPR